MIINQLIASSSALEMIFEAAEDLEWITTYAMDACVYLDAIEGNYIGLQFNDTNQITYNKEKVEEILVLESDAQYDEDVIVPDTTHIIRNTKAGIIACVNLQCYKCRIDGGTLLYKLRDFSAEQFVRELPEDYIVL